MYQKSQFTLIGAFNYQQCCVSDAVYQIENLSRTASRAEKLTITLVSLLFFPPSPPQK